jgi:hypothetical protein
VSDSPESQNAADEHVEDLSVASEQAEDVVGGSESEAQLLLKGGGLNTSSLPGSGSFDGFIPL